MATLWSGNKILADEAAYVQGFTAGADRVFDATLARYDVLGSLAHVQMLATIGLIEKADEAILLPALRRILEEIEASQFEMAADAEDIHSAIEIRLTFELGEAGKKIHTARSRNDQVLVDLKLFFKAELKALATQVGDMVTVLLGLSEKYKAWGMPGYTHYQVAMPSSFGLWFGAYAESLTEDLFVVEAAYRLADKNPLGSAAGFGSSFPINREQTTQLLGFGDLHWNSLNAQMSRGKTERAVASALAAVAATVARLAGDIVLYASQNYGFVTLPAYLSTGSSIMPHKKNPDVFELLRARGNRLQALPNTIALVQANLPSGYHRDFQILKENIFPAITELQESLAMLAWALPRIEPVAGLLEQPIYRYVGTVEDVNRLVLSGLPFRTAYQQVAAAVEAGTYQPTARPAHAHQGSLDNLSNNKIAKQLLERLATFK